MKFMNFFLSCAVALFVVACGKDNKSESQIPMQDPGQYQPGGYQQPLPVYQEPTQFQQQPTYLQEPLKPNQYGPTLLPRPQYPIDQQHPGNFQYDPNLIQQPGQSGQQPGQFGPQGPVGGQQPGSGPQGPMGGQPGQFSPQGPVGGQQPGQFGPQGPMGQQNPWLVNHPGLIQGPGQWQPGGPGFTQLPPQQYLPLPPMPQLPPQGPIGLPHMQNYFGGLISPVTGLPVYDPQYAQMQADLFYRNRWDIRQFHQAYQFFSRIQVVQYSRYCFLFDGRMAVEIARVAVEQQGFRMEIFQNYFYDCLRRGMPHQVAIQQAFYRMNVRVDVRRFVL